VGGDRHEDALVDGGEERDGEEEECGEGPHRDDKPRRGPWAEVVVHAHGLLHREGGHLGLHCLEEGAHGPDEKQLHHHLHLLHLCHCGRLLLVPPNNTLSFTRDRPEPSARELRRVPPQALPDSIA
jgi:hypothetical protein